VVLRNRVVERARSYRRRGSRAYIERTVGRSQDGRLGAATTFEVPASANSSEFPLTNNTAARTACALPASRNAGAFGKLRAACVRYCADLGCPRITPRFIHGFDSYPSLRFCAGCAVEGKDRRPVRAGYAEAWSVRTAS